MKIFLLVASLLGSPAFAGSNTSTIECKSDSGRTTFFAESWDLFSESTQIRFTIDGKSLDFSGSILYQYEDGVITVAGKNAEHQEVTFWSLPTKVKVKSKDAPLEVDFRAKVQGSDPRNPMEWSKLILLNCKLYYSI
jgi:hypothetical protein